MTQRSNNRLAARQRARERRLKLDADRIAREERVDAAVADFELVRADFDAVRGALTRAEIALGHAVAAVLAEGEPVERVAALCELLPTDVRRLSKLAGDQGATAAKPAPRSRGAGQLASAGDGGKGVAATADVA